MKIGLDAPNGFTKHFSNEDYKYLNQQKPSTQQIIKTPKTEGNSTHTYSMPALSSESPETISSSSQVTPDSQKDTVSWPEASQNLPSLPKRLFWLPPECMQIFASSRTICKPSFKSMTTRSKDSLLLNLSPIFCQRLSTVEDSSPTIPSTWLPDSTLMEKELSMATMPLEATDQKRQWPKEVEPTWSYHFWTPSASDTTTPSITKSPRWHPNQPSI